MVEHTHTFCPSDAPEDHLHHSADACLSVYQSENNQPNQQLPTTNDYYELKLCLSPTIFFKTLLISPTKQNNFIESHLLENSFSDDIFHPPIS